MTDPLQLEDAIAAVANEAAPLPAERVEATEAPDRVIAEDVASAIDLPPFANSAMDGYAMRASDTTLAAADNPAKLQLTGESRAGSPATESLGPHCAIGISTGAALPDGADAVLRVEDAEVAAGTLSVTKPIESGKDVRPAADDISAGDAVLTAGTTIRAGELAMLASVGATDVLVHRRPRVALIATGDELVSPGDDLAPGQIYDSNSTMLARLVAAAGGRLTHVDTRVADERAAVDAALHLGLDNCDVLIACGGVSKGEHDHVKPALLAARVEQRFWQVGLRPGHPTWFGVRPDGERKQLVFGLPGNPVSAFVTFHLFAAPALQRLAGSQARNLSLQAKYDGPDLHKRRGFALAVRCRLRNVGDELVAELTSENQRSHAVSSAVGANGLIIAGADEDAPTAGATVSVQLIDS